MSGWNLLTGHSKLYSLLFLLKFCYLLHSILAFATHMYIHVCKCFNHICIFFKACPEGKKGPMCNDTCDCRNDAKCNPVSGQCTCKPGWTGRDCSKPCSNGTYGFLCLQMCQCQNNAQCDHLTGNYCDHFLQSYLFSSCLFLILF